MKPAKVNFNTVRSIFFFGLIVVLLIAMLYLFQPFFYPIFWAAIIAVVFKPIYNFFLRHTKTPAVSSLITIIITIVVLFLPLTIIGLIAANESASIISRASTGGGFIHNVQNVTNQLKGTVLGPYIEPALEKWDEYAINISQFIGSFIFNNIKNITENSLKFIFMLFVTFYTLFFFLKDGSRMLKKLMHLSPLGDEYETLLYEKFTSTARATLKTTIIVGTIQGTIGGLLFWLTGINGAIIWGIIMTVLSIIPGIGSFIVWLPTGIIMLALGNVWQGITIILVGTFVISIIDNFLRPPLLGKDTQMHSLIAFFSTLGGILLFGISGFVIGPVLASLFLAVMSIYDYYYTKELKHN